MRNSNIAFQPQQTQRPDHEQYAVFGDIVHKTEVAAKIPIWHTGIAFVLSFCLVGSLAQTQLWVGWFWWDIFISFALASAVFLFSLWRWNVKSEMIARGDLNFDGKPDIPSTRVLVFKIERPDGTQVVHTDIPEEWQSDIMTVARAFSNHRPTTQTAMKSTYRIGRKKLERIMGYFLQLDIIEKAGSKPNDPYVLVETDEAIQIMRNLGYGHFETLKDVWSEDN